MERKQPWRKTFFTIWTGQAVSLLTSAIVQFAIIWHLTAATKSPIILSAATFVGFLPQGILGPFIGVYLDRWDRKRVMILSDLSIAAACLCIVVAGQFSDLPVWVFLAVLFVRSLGSAFHSPSLAAVTPLLVPEEQLTRCAGYSQALQSASMVLSPALAAMLFSAWPLEDILFLDVLGALCGVGTLAVCRIPKLPKPEAVERPRLLREAADGFRVLRDQRGLFGLLLVSIVFSIFFMPINAFYPLMTMDYFGRGAAGASMAEIAFSVGMLAGSLLLGAWGGFRRRVVSVSLATLLLGVFFAVSGLLPPAGFAAFVILSGLEGFVCPFFNGVVIALYQEKIPPDYLGRVMSLSTSAMVLASPIGLAVAGPLAEVIGVSHWFVVAGVAIILCGIACVVSPAIRECDR